MSGIRGLFARKQQDDQQQDDQQQDDQQQDDQQQQQQDDQQQDDQQQDDQQQDDQQQDDQQQDDQQQQQDSSAATIDALQRELFTLRAAATGLLQDVSDLPYNAALETPEQVKAAAEQLLEDKPHLRRIGGRGNVGLATDNGNNSGAVSLTALLRNNS